MIMALYDELNEARHKVQTDSYPMSIGELINLYQDGDLEISPEFQRVFRWKNEQKSKLIESILLGIPLPSIFVAQREDGVWDVVDGLQRLSTIFSFVGVLKNGDGQLITPPLELLKTKYLPSMDGKVWEDNHNQAREIGTEIKRIFKREKIDIKIIKRESQTDTKFEMFQRVNTGGSKLSEQEVRNCMLLMINKDAFHWLEKISKNQNFQNTLPISEKREEESYFQELALRFIIQRHYSEKLLKDHSDFGPYLDDELIRIFNSSKTIIDLESEEDIFEKTFALLDKALGEDAFKKYNCEKERWLGPVSTPVFEVISTGVSKLIEERKSPSHEQIKQSLKQLVQHETFQQVLNKNMRPIVRIQKMATLGTEIFN